MPRRHRILSTALVTGALTAALAAPAGAQVVERYSSDFSDEGTMTDFCGVDGLAPTYTVTQEVTGFLREQGRDKLWYFHDRIRAVQTLTWEGMTVTDIQPNTLVKDLEVVDNGDGTVTVTRLLTGGSRLLGSDGKLLAKNDGQVREQIVFDTVAGEVISSEIIFGSTGTNDDFCEAILEHWGL
ncbi:hypothetical protein ACQE98_10190 [Ornithinimicrobium sp. W1679]|uniref:hypothetical protein n=1 Tax=Ornithinimicrobium sp. W1679 TaxID=3418770 RepID=UPI003CF40E02